MKKSAKCQMCSHLMKLFLFLLLTLSCNVSKTFESKFFDKSIKRDSMASAAVDDADKGKELKGGQEEIPLDESPVEYLELCYATSVNMPDDRYGPENVFDGDSTSFNDT